MTVYDHYITVKTKHPTIHGALIAKRVKISLPSELVETGRNPNLQYATIDFVKDKTREECGTAVLYESTIHHVDFAKQFYKIPRVIISSNLNIQISNVSSSGFNIKSDEVISGEVDWMAKPRGDE